MERRRQRVEEWLRRAVALNREAEASRAKAAALLAEKEQLQRYLDSELPQLQQRLAETTQEITQLYTGKEMAETQLSEKTQTVDRYAHLMSELSSRVSLFLGEKSGLERMIEEVQEKNQFLIAKVNKFKASEETAAEREKKQKEQIKAREATIKLLNQTVANFRADLAAVRAEAAAMLESEGPEGSE